jgi:hypothetical protein
MTNPLPAPIPNPQSLNPERARAIRSPVLSTEDPAAYQRLIRLNESRHIEYVRFYMQPPGRAASASY